MMDALSWVLQLPTWLAIPALFLIVLARSHATYWLGRAASGGAGQLVRASTHRAGAAPGGERPAEAVSSESSASLACSAPSESVAPPASAASSVVAVPRWRRTVDQISTSPAAQRAQSLVHRWGALAVTGAYFTVGLQSAVFVSAGLIRMPYPRFTLASVPGSAGWALLWFGVGVGAWWAVGKLGGSLPWLVAAAAMIVTACVIARRRSGAGRSRAQVGEDRLASRETA